MNLQTIATHTIDIDLLRPGGIILDAGCRDFDFSREMNQRGQTVIAIDADPEVKADEPHWEKHYTHHLALVETQYITPTIRNGKMCLVSAGNGSRVVRSETGVEVPTTSMLSLFGTYGSFDVVKLDIEGSEYGVLLTWPGAEIAKQISVEFHEHTNLGKAVHGDDIYSRIDRHLGQWYRKVKDELMDTLYILK